MFKVALCDCPNSKEIIESKIKAFLGISATEVEFHEFESFGQKTKTGIHFDACFINHSQRSNMESILKFIEQGGKPHGDKLSFITYVNDPVTDEDCDRAVDILGRYLGYGSINVAVEVLTDKGLKSITISKILYFEFVDRKVKIKTQNGVFYCNDTLKNIMKLVGTFDFHQPHKSFIVNLKHITEIKNYTVTMNDGSQIPLSQKKSKEFRAIYKIFAKPKQPSRLSDAISATKP